MSCLMKSVEVTYVQSTLKERDCTYEGGAVGYRDPLLNTATYDPWDITHFAA